MIRLRLKQSFRHWPVLAILLGADIIAGLVAYSRAIIPSLEQSEIAIDTIWAIFIILQLVWTILLYTNGRYQVDPTLSRFGEIQSLFKITLLVTVVTVIGNELFVAPVNIPSAVLLKYWFFLVFGLTLGRLSIRQVQKLFLKRGYGVKNTLVVGINHKAKIVANQLGDGYLGYNVVGFVTPDVDKQEDGEIGGMPILGSLRDLQKTIHEHSISEVVIALDKPNHSRLLDILTLSNGSPVSLKIIPDMYEVVSGLAKTEQIYGLPLVQINPEIITIQQRVLKRLVDLTIAFVVAVPLFPIWAIVAIAIKLDSRGPILYRQERVGVNGRRIMLNKFRSMVHNAESFTGPVWAREEDPRITSMGTFLRRFRLDEFPQFINVLKGDMSIVGPRPERPYFVQKLMEEFPFYYRRHKMRPGITGWAQIKHSYDSSLEDVRQKLKYDFFYIENYSLSLDFLIMLRTVAVMLSGRGQ